MLTIEGKTFMNIQEAVQWLLDNNCIPFQCTANYLANTEIGLGTIVNPSPAKLRIGSLIFFADSKVSTVVGITETSFICSDKYNNLVDDIAYVTNVAINASGHLITTLSDGQTIDAGIVKQVSGFNINASQHLIVTYNDGTTTDLGAIFNGNINISGNLTVSGGISGNAITGDSIIENMSGYSMTTLNIENLTQEAVYGGVVKNGNKVTIAIALKLTRTGTIASSPPNPTLVTISIPSSVGSKLYVAFGSLTLSKNKFLATNLNNVLGDKDVVFSIFKDSNTVLSLVCNYSILNDLELNNQYYIRIESTFLLSENLLS